jgi:hypothetical protein
MAAESSRPTVAELIAESQALRLENREARERQAFNMENRYRLLRELSRMKVEFHTAVAQAHRAPRS